MQNNWKRCTIGQLCEDGAVELQTGPFGTQLHAHDYVDDGVAVVPTEAIRDRNIDHSVLPKITPHKADELARHRLELRDILFARRGVQATGHIGFVRQEEEGFICGTGAIRLRVVHDDDLDAEFLSHVLANPASVAWFKFHAIGATMPNLNEGIIRSFPFLLPEPCEQRAIAAVLSALDDKIDLNHRMNETLEAMARALFKSWFVDFDPVNAKAGGEQPWGMDAATAALFPEAFEDSELSEIPHGWRVSPLSDGVDILSGGTPKTTEPEFWDGDVPWVSVVDTSPGPYIVSTEKCISDQGLAHSAARLLPQETLVITARGTVGNCALLAREMAMNQSCYGLRGKEGVGQLFLLQHVREQVARLKAAAHGSVFDTITRATFERLHVLWPSSPVVAAFDSIVRPWFDAVLNNAHEVVTLRETRDTLLPKLLSGEVRVGDGERAVEVAV